MHYDGDTYCHPDLYPDCFAHKYAVTDCVPDPGSISVYNENRGF